MTAGTSTPLVVAGVAIVAAGIGGEVGSAIALKNLNDTKASLLQEKSNLKAEVQLATGISGAYKSLGTQVNEAVLASTQIQNAWNFLSSDLGDLDKGIKSTGETRTVFLTAANTEVKTVIQDTQTIND